jgi:hypothetical protein
MKYLRPLEYWDRGFESNLWHGRMSTSFLFVSSCVVGSSLSTGCSAPYKEPYQLSVGFTVFILILKWEQARGRNPSKDEEN